MNACHNESDTKAVFAGAGGTLLPYGGTFLFIVQSEQVQRRHLGMPIGLHESMLACFEKAKTNVIH